MSHLFSICFEIYINFTDISWKKKGKTTHENDERRWAGKGEKTGKKVEDWRKTEKDKKKSEWENLEDIYPLVVRALFSLSNLSRILFQIKTRLCVHLSRNLCLLLTSWVIYCIAVATFSKIQCSSSKLLFVFPSFLTFWYVFGTLGLTTTPKKQTKLHCLFWLPYCDMQLFFPYFPLPFWVFFFSSFLAITLCFNIAFLINAFL